MSAVPAPGVAKSRHKRILWAHGWGGVTHNMAAGQDPVVVTIWGRADKEPDREVGLSLDEDGVRQMVMRLRAYGLL